MNRYLKDCFMKFFSFIPDKQYLELRYYLSFHKKLDLAHPVTYNEKIQWMKLYDRNPIYSDLVDKEKVKEYVNCKGIVKVIPTLKVYNRPEEIDFEELPESFVLKCTHDSGSVLLFKNKHDHDIEYVKKHFKRAMKKKQYLGGREWAYKNVKPRIIAEPYMIDSFGDGLRDYKFFCFDGVVKAMFVATDRGKKDTDVKFDFFDENFNHLDLKHGHENALITPIKPSNFEELKKAAGELSKGLRAVRVDLYEINNEVYFGEMTFYHHCGFVPFEPYEWDRVFGDWIDIR